jgi:hypothetical protein
MFLNTFSDKMEGLLENTYFRIKYLFLGTYLHVQHTSLLQHLSCSCKIGDLRIDWWFEKKIKSYRITVRDD